MPPKKDELGLAVALLAAKLTILRGDYVRRDEFSPVKQVVFGLVAVILLAVVGAMVTLVLRG